MQADSALTWGATHLRDSGSTTPRLDASVLLAHLLDVPRTILLGFPERTITPEIAQVYHVQIARRAAGEPVAYLTGHKEFMGLDLLVDSRVLVPRPETELVVEAALGSLLARLGEDEATAPQRRSRTYWRRTLVLAVGPLPSAWRCWSGVSDVSTRWISPRRR